MTPGNVKTALLDADAEQDDLHFIPLENLVVDPTFNVRIKDDEYDQQVDLIRQSILANGFYRHAPLSGYVGQQAGHDVIFLTGGFTRYEAACRAQEDDYRISHVPVVLHPPNASRVDLIVALANDNTGRPLRPLEKASVCKRLRDEALSESEIGRRLNIDRSYVNTLLRLIQLPEEMQELVAEEKVPVQMAMKQVRQHGPDKAYEVIREAVSNNNRRQLGTPTTRQSLTAIDRAIEIRDIDWLSSWRRGEEGPVAEVQELVKAARRK